MVTSGYPARASAYAVETPARPPPRTTTGGWAAMSVDSVRRPGAVLAILLLLAAALRVWVALQPGLWVDEIFSIAIATGHSLEHPAAVADPALGDYVEPGGVAS